MLAGAAAVVGSLAAPASASTASTTTSAIVHPMAWWHQAYYANQATCLVKGTAGIIAGAWDDYTCQKDGPASAPWDLIVEQ